MPEIGAFVRHGRDGLHVVRVELFHFPSLTGIRI
jgi:hypothetical protein